MNDTDMGSLVHYVETRDDLELKVARINRRLQKLIQEGDHVSITHWYLWLS